MHRDIKPENIMYGEEDEIKFIEVPLSVVLGCEVEELWRTLLLGGVASFLQGAAVFGRKVL